MNTTVNEKKKEKIYSFWKAIPLIKNMEAEKGNSIQQETRSQILEILRTGIEDKHGEYSRRYALNVQEIRELLIQKNLKTSLQNIYFHLNILLEQGLITEIEILKEGRFNKRYYGRTAKLFLFGKSSDIPQERIEEIKNTFTNVIKAINADNITKKMDGTVELFLNERMDEFIKSEILLNEWFEKHAQSFIEYNIDVKLTYGLIRDLILNRDSTDHSKEMEHLLKI